ncbi:MAG: ASCH domain-containing protein [Pseudomonadota bacterium]
MQQLPVVARLFPLILSGEKTSTIRFREAPIGPGAMTYVCVDDPAKTAVVWVTRCTDMALSEVAAYLGRQTEWPDAVMLEGMREHYPEIEMTDTVQVIEHLTPAQTVKLMGSTPGSER